MHILTEKLLEHVLLLNIFFVYSTAFFFVVGYVVVLAVETSNKLKKKFNY